MKELSAFPLRMELHQHAYALPCEGAWGYGTKYGTNFRRHFLGRSNAPAKVKEIGVTLLKSFASIYFGSSTLSPFICAKWRLLNVATWLPRSRAVAPTIRS